MILVPLQYPADTICVTGLGCVLPGAGNSRAYWENLSSGRSSLSALPPERWNRFLPGVYEKFPELHPHLQKIGVVADEGLNIASGESRLEAMTLEALREAVGDDNSFLKERKIFAPLGCMSTEEAQGLFNLFGDTEDVFESLKREERFREIYAQSTERERAFTVGYQEQTLTRFFSKFSSVLGEKCSGAFVDAACASSLSALSIGVQRLKSREADVVVTGGIESDLTLASFLMFSRLGILSRGNSLPFDPRTDGMCQGEGAVIFLLERLEDAILDKRPIWGILSDVLLTSNGQSASLIAPSESAQTELFQEARKKSGGRQFDYIECHGTGTTQGDRSELKALSRALEGHAPVPIGSVKAMIGHTKGTAGAASLLKCLLAIHHRLIPPSSYWVEGTPVLEEDTPLRVSSNPVSLPLLQRPLYFGLSSSGFGGTNAWVAVEEYKPWTLGRPKQKTPTPIVVNGYAEISVSHAAQRLVDLGIRFPLKTMEAIGPEPVAAIAVVKESFERSALAHERVERKKVTVINASRLGMEISRKLSKRVHAEDFIARYDGGNREAAAKLRAELERLPGIDEDSGPATLNALVASRVCQTFNFQGKHFNVDSGVDSEAEAMSIAINELSLGESEMVILLLWDEDDAPMPRKTAVQCLILSTEETSNRKGWPKNYEVTPS